MRNVYGGYRTFNIIQLFSLTIVIVVSFFLIASIVSTAKKDLFYIGQVDRSIQIAPTETLVQLVSLENPYFAQELTEKEKSLSMSTMAFRLITNIHFGDLRSLVGNELPGYAFYDSKIVVAGEGTDYTTLPIESAPPLEVLLQEREMADAQLKELNKINEPKTPPSDAPRQKKVFIYHSHSWESYLPLLGLTGDPDENKAADSKTNITIIGDMLAKELESKNIGVSIDKTNILQALNQKGWVWAQSYNLSRTIVESAVAANNDLEYFLDLHRDSLRKDVTTATINNKPYARIAFVIGKGHNNYDKNLAFANNLHEILKIEFPGLSRGIIEKGTDVGNGIYNQDLSSKALTVEMGGVDNDIVELQNTVEALAEVISKYFWEVEKVDADG